MKNYFNSNFFRPSWLVYQDVKPGSKSAPVTLTEKQVAEMMEDSEPVTLTPEQVAEMMKDKTSAASKKLKKTTDRVVKIQKQQEIQATISGDISLLKSNANWRLILKSILKYKIYETGEPLVDKKGKIMRAADIIKSENRDVFVEAIKEAEEFANEFNNTMKEVGRDTDKKRYKPAEFITFTNKKLKNKLRLARGITQNHRMQAAFFKKMTKMLEETGLPLTKQALTIAFKILIRTTGEVHDDVKILMTRENGKIIIELFDPTTNSITFSTPNNQARILAIVQKKALELFTKMKVQARL